MSKKYLFVTTHYPPDYHYGGVVESGHTTHQELKKLCNIQIVCVSKNPHQVNNIINNDGRCYRSILFHKYGFSISLIPALYMSVKKADFIYCHGIVTFPNLLAQIFSIILKKPFALSTLGLTDWSFRNKIIIKLIFFNLFVFPILRRAKFIRVTSDDEAAFLLSKGVSNNVIKISHGIDINKYSNYYLYKKQDKLFTYLYLGRISREKGLDILISAYKELCNKLSDGHQLYIVGPYSKYVEELNLDKYNRIKYIPGVYGESKIKMIRNADVVILPSYSENFGNVIAESLICEVPVITTTSTPWKDIEKIGCGLYVRPNSNELLKAMFYIYNLPSDLRVMMGKLGRKYILENYDIKKKVIELFNYFPK